MTVYVHVNLYAFLKPLYFYICEGCECFLQHCLPAQSQTHCVLFWIACFSNFTQFRRILEVIAERVNTALFVWTRSKAKTRTHTYTHTHTHTHAHTHTRTHAHTHTHTHAHTHRQTVKQEAAATHVLDVEIGEGGHLDCPSVRMSKTHEQ